MLSDDSISRKAQKRKPVSKMHQSNANTMKLILFVILSLTTVLALARYSSKNEGLDVHNSTTLNKNNSCLDQIIPCPCHDPEVPHAYDDKKWLNAVETNRKRVQDTLDNMERNKISKLDIVFLGDSITEDWAGARFGVPDPRHEQTLEVFNSYFSLNSGIYKGLALGISGDTSPNLLWRLRNGEMPSMEKGRPLRSRVWWVLIGTNDFGRSLCSEEAVTTGIKTVLEEVLSRAEPDDIVVMNSLLPRDYFKDPDDLIFWKKIKMVNESVRQICKEKKENGFHVVFSDHNDIFLSKDGKSLVNKDLMPDKLHPNADGHKLWAEQIVQTLDSLLDRAPFDSS